MRDSGNSPGDGKADAHSQPNASPQAPSEDTDGQDNGEPHEYASVAIVGMGLIGGSIALGLRSAGYRGTILGVSREASLAQAKDLGAIDHGVPYEQLEAVAEAELVILSTPISTILEHLHRLGELGDRLRPGTVVTDVGSTKRVVLEAAARHLPEHVTFIGGHPMAGSEFRGMPAADPLLFQSAYYILTPHAHEEGSNVSRAETDRLGAFVGRLGARVLVLDAEAHDRTAATISHLPQLLAVSLVRFLDSLGENRDDGIHLAAGGFRDMTRIASSPFAVWQDIFATNRDLVQGILGQFLENVQTTYATLDDKVLKDEFARAEETRAEIPRDTKGFLSRLWNVLVVVEDKPGRVAGVAVPLSKQGINIKDIEVLKVREGEAGSLRLAFASQNLAARAVDILRAEGFEARVRK